MSLPTVEFMRRFLLHVLPFRFMKIRNVGFLSNRIREESIRICREFLEAKSESVPQRQENADFTEYLREVESHSIEAEISNVLDGIQGIVGKRMPREWQNGLLT